MAIQKVTSNVIAANAVDAARIVDGSITTADIADANITSGKLASAITITSLTATNTISGNVSGTAATVTTAAQPNITSVGTLTSLASSGNIATSELNLNAITKDISDTAQVVFIYDTRKDSDGGAWRKRTQNTSWYNEAASATRSSRKEFPSVAVIVGTSSGATIYDADDPDMPMWMVFVKTTPIFGRSNAWGQGIRSCEMLNGVLTLGNGSNSAEGLLKVNFISDDGFLYSIHSYSEYGGPYDSDIASRANSYDYGTAGTTVIISSPANDISMTVLPNAPIDAATGLPVPTIAVATGGGVSVIKDDGTVIDISPTNAKDANIIDFSNNFLYVSTDVGTYNGNTIYKFNIPASDEFEGFYSQSSSFIADFGTLIAGTHVGNQGNGLVNGSAYGSSLYGLGLLNEDIDTPTNSQIAYITSDYNTGWMPPSIKLATLSDTSTTNVTGTELVTNGTFTSNTTGWNAIQGATLSIDANRIKVTGGGTAYPAAEQVITLEVGKTYTASATYTRGNASIAYFNMGKTTGQGQYASVAGSATSGTLTHTFTATQTTLYLAVFGSASTTHHNFWDNVTLRLAEKDRSTNKKGLQVFGTVTKTAVATGADLVGYSGFSSSNYLQQAYNSDIEVGTGDFCSMGWYYVASGSIGQREYIVVLDGGAGSNIFAKEYNNYFQFLGTNSLEVVSAGKWYFYCGVVANGLKSLYINGKKQFTAASTHNLSDNSDGLRIGSHTGNAGWNARGSMALYRFSATAPSPEQIAKIYNDEKQLFQENAKATLYGTSDAVTALAHDDSTDLLHAGTSAGRSVFQGLRRVDNTTNAVGSTISASNGIVAED